MSKLDNDDRIPIEAKSSPAVEKGLVQLPNPILEIQRLLKKQALPYNPQINAIQYTNQTVSPVLETQKFLSNLTFPSNQIAAINNAVKIATPMLETVKKLGIHKYAHKYAQAAEIASKLSKPIGMSAIDMSVFYVDTLAPQIANAISPKISAEILASTQKIIANYSSLIKISHSPFIDWLRKIDFSRLTPLWKSSNLRPPYSREYIIKVYLQAMYDAKWFPYVGWIARLCLLANIKAILASSRGMSKRCQKRIDKAIISYYTDTEIKSIKKQWLQSNLKPHVKKALGQVIEAYLRREYALVIPFLATMWEGIIQSKIAENRRQTKKDLKNLVDENGYDDVFSDFYNNFIFGPCYSTDDIVDGVPNRHATAHGWYTKYPNRKAALNAILLTDFLINLKPKKALVQNTTPNSKQEVKVNG